VGVGGSEMPCQCCHSTKVEHHKELISYVILGPFLSLAVTFYLYLHYHICKLAFVLKREKHRLCLSKKLIVIAWLICFTFSRGHPTINTASG
jgi:hypothetical protein